MEKLYQEGSILDERAKMKEILRNKIESSFQKYQQVKDFVLSPRLDYTLPMEARQGRKMAVSILEVLEREFDEEKRVQISKKDELKEAKRALGLALGTVGFAVTYLASSKLAQDFSASVAQDWHYLTSGVSWLGQALISLAPPAIVAKVLYSPHDQFFPRWRSRIEKEMDAADLKKQICGRMLEDLIKGTESSQVQQLPGQYPLQTSLGI